MAGYEVTPVKTDARGNIDVDDLRTKVDEHTAALMLTNPSTLGLFDENIEEIEQIFHGAGALMYYDGANLNAVVRHLAPRRHGLRHRAHQPAQDVLAAARRRRAGRRPDRGARTCSSRSCPCRSVVRDEDGTFGLDFDRPKSIGKVRAFTGPFGVFVRSYAYIRAYGPRLREMSETAVLNANYVLARLKDAYELPYDRLCMHEFVLSARNLKRDYGVTALDIAKRLMDYGFHPPTIYFPLVVPEALMIEPTETETKETLDAFCDAMLAIARGGGGEPRAAEGRRRTTVPCGGSTRCAPRSIPIVKYGFEQHPERTRRAGPSPSRRRGRLGGLRRRRGVAVAAALVVIVLALMHEAADARRRSITSVRRACSCLPRAIAAALLVLAPRVPSLGVAIGAGIAAGGALGHARPGIAWDGVPDPLVHGGDRIQHLRSRDRGRRPDSHRRRAGPRVGASTTSCVSRYRARALRSGSRAHSPCRSRRTRPIRRR